MKNQIILKIIHYTIIFLLFTEFLYAGFILFFVLKPAGLSGPLWGKAIELVKTNPDLLMARRAYATEAWIAFAGLAVYLAITEIGPRMRAESK